MNLLYASSEHSHAVKLVGSSEILLPTYQNTQRNVQKIIASQMFLAYTVAFQRMVRVKEVASERLPKGKR
jgi:hypothetical protein